MNDTYAENRPVTNLRIGARQTSLGASPGHGADATAILNLGFVATADAFFAHSPPVPSEIENAISAIEDEIQRVHKSIVAGSALVTSDESIGRLAELAEVREANPFVLSVEAVENLYQRLAAISYCALVSSDPIESSPTHVVTVLILRELMHHLGFSTINIISQDNLTA